MSLYYTHLESIKLKSDYDLTNATISQEGINRHTDHNQKMRMKTEKAPPPKFTGKDIVQYLIFSNISLKRLLQEIIIKMKIHCTY